MTHGTKEVSVIVTLRHRIGDHHETDNSQEFANRLRIIMEERFPRATVNVSVTRNLELAP